MSESEIATDGSSGSKRKRKDKVKKKYQDLMAPPRFLVEPTLIKEKITVADLRDLVLYVMGADGIGPKWCSVRNAKAIERFVTILVPGLNADLFGLGDADALEPIRMNAPEQLPFFQDTFGMAWPTKAPGEKTSLYSPSNVFVEVPMTKSEKKELGASIKKVPKKVELHHLEMSCEDLKHQGFLIHPDTKDRYDPIQPLLEGWMDTKPIDRENKEAKVYGLDCEMCLTNTGSEVTRVTLVENSTRETVLDEFVKPYNDIIDYVTAFSGITKELLENVTNRLDDVQQKLLELVSTTDYLVGHSLDSDLTALQLRHPKIIDTSIIYHHPRGPPYKASLKMLTGKHLKREIQTGTQGHDSAEDAIACLDLLNLKLERGGQYGLHRQQNIDLATKLTKYKKTVAIVDYGVPRWHNEQAKAVISCTSDDEIVDKTVKCSKTHDFVWASMRDLRIPGGWMVSKDGKGVVESDEGLDQSFEKLNDRLTRLYKGLPANTALLIWSGSGNPVDMIKLQKQRKAFNDEYKSKKWDELETTWTDTDNKKLLQATRAARAGISFLTVKTQQQVDGEPDDQVEADISANDDYDDGPTKRSKSEE